MSRISMGVVVALAIVGLVVIIMAAGRIVTAQIRAPAPAASAPAPLPGEIVRSVMPAVISLVMLIPSSVIVVSRSTPPEHQRWATAAISNIITYWLR